MADPWRGGGYAHFPGSYAGPAMHALSCDGCRFMNAMKSKYRAEYFCEKAHALSGKRCLPIKPAAPACKYWEEK